MVDERLSSECRAHPFRRCLDDFKLSAETPLSGRDPVSGLHCPAGFHHGAIDANRSVGAGRVCCRPGLVDTDGPQPHIDSGTAGHVAHHGLVGKKVETPGRWPKPPLRGLKVGSGSTRIVFSGYTVSIDVPLPRRTCVWRGSSVSGLGLWPKPLSEAASTSLPLPEGGGRCGVGCEPCPLLWAFRSLPASVLPNVAPGCPVVLLSPGGARAALPPSLRAPLWLEQNASRALMKSPELSTAFPRYPQLL